MSKKRFILPFVILEGWGGDGSDTGGGSGGTSPDITGCTYNEWLEMYADDYDLDDDTDFDDYKTWWFENGLSEELWNELNPGVPLTEAVFFD